MKNLVLSLMLLLFVANSAFSQCNMVIYPTPGHIKIDSDQTLDATTTPYWVCTGLTLP